MNIRFRPKHLGIAVVFALLFGATPGWSQGNASSAAGGEASAQVRFSARSLQALEEIREFRKVAGMAKYGKLLGPFQELFTESGAGRLQGVYTIATTDWEQLAREAVEISEREAKTIALMAENTQRELKSQGWSGLVSKEEIEFWGRLATTYKPKE